MALLRGYRNLEVESSYRDWVSGNVPYKNVSCAWPSSLCPNDNDQNYTNSLRVSMPTNEQGLNQ